MLVRTIMTPKPRTLEAGGSLADAIELMVGYRIRHLPIVDDGRVVGIISERDVKMALGPDAADMDLASVDPRQADGTVEWFMTESTVTVPSDTPLSKVAALFIERRFGAMPVVDDGDLVGIVSVIDLLRASQPLWKRAEAG